MLYRHTLLALLCCAIPAAAQRSAVDLKSWEFSQDKVRWEKVSVPHDWAIKGPFDKKWDLQHVAIVQNGETEKTEKSGRSGALPWIGKGYYRTHIDGTSLQGKRLVLSFDGAMSEPRVFIDGRPAGHWAYGYNAFRIDATPHILPGDNLIEVELQNLEESSRWYPGAGLYRPVQLLTTSPLAINDWSLFCHTASIENNRAHIKISAALTKYEPGVEVTFALRTAKGKNVCSSDIAPKDSVLNTVLTVNSPRLWTPDTPYLYQLTATVRKDGKVVDKYTIPVGIRTIGIDASRGFLLNGKVLDLKGVCLHHDLGPLGAAVNKTALIRQVKLMKDMGANAIRIAHNMPSQMQMQVYDSLGMVVMAESFDMWRYPKVKNGYSRFFDSWSERDITNLVLANRNHPSLIMYSIGNEIPEQWSAEGRTISKQLQDLCHSLDSTRLVTQGMDQAEAALKSGFAQVMDVPGFNYRVWKYANNISQLPQKFLLGSETASTVSSRGVYHFPVQWSNALTYPDGQCNGYDTQWCSWSNLPEEDFMAQEDLPYYIGQFVWTGFDYLGEPTPYDSYWPSRSSYFGICDLAGLPKDRYYLYRSVWNKEAHTLHILPHWTWKGREGELTPVFVYTDYPAAELFINGKSCGIRVKNKSKDSEYLLRRAATSEDAQRRAQRYRLMWDDVRYTPGEVKVVAYDAHGIPVQEAVMRTAEEPAQIRLVPDRRTLKADGEELCFVTVSLVDKHGTELPTSDDKMSFEVAGAGKFKAVCNGDATSLESFTEPSMKLFSGKLVVVLQAGTKRGKIKLRVVSTERPELNKTLVLRVK